MQKLPRKARNAKFGISIMCWLAITALGFTTCAGPKAQEVTTATPPNIILIMADDLGYSDLGCYGSEISTPNIDRLAGGGLRFTQFYNNGKCCPSRASLMTGLYPHQTGIGHMTTMNYGRPGYSAILNEESVTIATILKDNGYRTYLSGKWHLAHLYEEEVIKGDDGQLDKRNWPRQRGFDEFYGTINGATGFWDPYTLVRDNRLISAFADPEYHPDETYYYTDAISDHAVGFLNDNEGDSPYFLYIAYTAPHWPIHAREADIAKYDGVYDGGFEPVRNARVKRMQSEGLIDPAWTLSPIDSKWDTVSNKAWEIRNMEAYAAMIDNMDQGIGRILEAVEQRGELDNSLILFLSDNGGCAENKDRYSSPAALASVELHQPSPDDALQTKMKPDQTRDGRRVRRGYGVMPGSDTTYGYYGLQWANVSNTPYRRYKSYGNEGGIAAPLIVHWPDRLQPKGGIARDIVHITDLVPTLLEAAEVRYSEGTDEPQPIPLEGNSLLPVLRGQTLPPRPVYMEHMGNRAIRLGEWKLVAQGPSGAWELYNMTTDRTETTNLATKHPERVDELAADWEAWATRTNVLPWPWDQAATYYGPSRAYRRE